MLKWVQSGLSAVAGTAEPEYGPDAIQPITKRIFDTNNGKIYRATEPKDFEWLSPNYTNVETQTFYFTDLSNGNIGCTNYSFECHGVDNNCPIHF